MNIKVRVILSYRPVFLLSNRTLLLKRGFPILQQDRPWRKAPRLLVKLRVSSDEVNPAAVSKSQECSVVCAVAVKPGGPKRSAQHSPGRNDLHQLPQREKSRDDLFRLVVTQLSTHDLQPKDVDEFSKHEIGRDQLYLR